MISLKTPSRGSLTTCDSSVDVETDELMQKVIRSRFKDCTIIAIAHKLDTILDFDKIALLDKDHVVEFDAPRTLLRTEGSCVV